MKRKIIYACVIVTLITVITGIYFFQRNADTNQGKMGDQIVDFSSSESFQQDTSEENAVETEEPQKEDKKKNDEYQKIINTGKVKVYDNTGTVVVGDTGFEIYNYVDTFASRYIRTINKITDKLGKKTKVYEMIVPTSAGITFPDNLKNKINTSSQKAAIEKMEKKLSGKQKVVSLYKKMMEHRMEYIYYRTDHHWTSLGAYYAYQEFCEKKGISYNYLEDYKMQSSSGFLGSFYLDSSKNKALKKDTVESYFPKSKKISMEYLTAKGGKIKAPIILDTKKLGATSKYFAFLSGDNPFTTIKNPQVKDGSSIVVVKESFGNALVPYLADHYQTIYVIDYRYWNGNIANFVKKKKIKELLFVNNISMTRNAYLIGKLDRICN